MKLVKSPWECGISKWVEEAQRKAIGPWMPKGKPKGTYEPMSKSKIVPITGH